MQQKLVGERGGRAGNEPMFYIYVIVTGWGGITLTIPCPSQQWSHNVYQNLEKAWERGYYIQH